MTADNTTIHNALSGKKDISPEYVHEETHESSSVHHRHSHAEHSQHACGHHLLQVEDLSMSFSM